MFLIDNICKMLILISMESGIYKIINNVDGKYYVGSSRNIFGDCVLSLRGCIPN